MMKEKIFGRLFFMEGKVLVLGATGAMGIYLVPELVKRGFRVDAVALDAVSPFEKNVRYMQGDALDAAFADSLTAGGYDAVVDFLIYEDIARFYRRQKTFLRRTGQYIYLSSYRVYANEDAVITESSPRLLDVSKDAAYLAKNEYGLYKAKGENILWTAKEKNWTIVRPAITYSKFRFQLVTLEANAFLPRAKAGKKVYLPDAAMGVQATMSWAGDVAAMIAGLVCNPAARAQAFTVATAEHHTWREVAEIYKRLIGLDYEVIPAEDYLDIVGRGGREQLYYDRCFDRVIDNSKILAAAGMEQRGLTTLEEGLKRELAALPADYAWPNTHVDMDAYRGKEETK